MKNFSSFLTVLLLFSISANAQLHFSNYYGNADANYGLGNMQYIKKRDAVYGVGLDGRFMKFNLNGELQWVKNTGGQYNLSFTTTPSGGFLIAGVNWVAGVAELGISKTDSAGNVIGGYTITGVRLLDPKIIQAGPDKDEYFIKGWYDSGTFADDILLLKVNSKGKLIWQYHYDQTFFDEQTGGMVTDNAGGVYLSGLSIQGGGKLFWSHVNADGIMDQIKYYGNSFGPCDNMIRAADGGFIISGIYNNGGSSLREPFVLKIDAAGNMLWFHGYHNAAINVAFGYSGNCSLAEDGDGNVYAAGLSGFTSAFYLRVMKVNADGTLAWIKEGEASASYSYYQTSVLYFKKGGSEQFWIADSKDYGDVDFGLNDLVVTSETPEFSSCIWTEIFPTTFTESFPAVNGNVTRYTADLNKIAPPAASTLEMLLKPLCVDSMIVAANENMRLLPPVKNNYSESDSLAYIKMLQDRQENITPASLNIYPNPASGQIHIINDQQEMRIQIFDMQGKCMIEPAIYSGSVISINLQALPEGMYMVESTDSNNMIISRGTIMVAR